MCAPVTKSRPSTLGTVLPAIFHCDGGRDGDGLDVGGKGLEELLAAGELAVGEGALARCLDDLAVLGGEAVAGDLPALGGEVDERLARGRRDGAKLRAHVGRRAAAEGARVPRAEVGVAHDHADRVHGNVELLGDLLRERGPDVLADLDLAGEDGHLAVLVDVEPGGEVLRELLGGPPRAAGLLGGELGRGDADGQAAAEELEEAAAVEVEPVEGRDLLLGELGVDVDVGAAAHFDAAFLTAATMRLCVPQRQTLRASVSTMSAVSRLRLRFEQRDRRDDHPGRAVAALEGFRLEERRLDGMELAVLARGLRS